MEIILLTIGILIYVAINLNREYVHNEFDWGDFFWKHASAMFISAMLGIAVMLTTDYGTVLAAAFEKIGKLTYIVIGFAGQSIFNGLVEMFTKNIKTRWGRN